MVTFDTIAYPETQIKTVGLDDTAWLLDVEIDTLLLWIDRGVIKAFDTDKDGNIEFKREDVADLLYLFGA